MNKQIYFKRELDWIKNENIKKLAIQCRDNAPDYFYCVPASTTGKYHNLAETGLSGLYRHSCGVTRFIHHFLALEQNFAELTEEEMDMLIVAGMFHDVIKLGLNGSQYTVADHPLQSSKFVREQNALLDEPLEEDAINFICNSIESHSGHWNTNKKGVEFLPKPITHAQKLVHMADYCASRKDISVDFAFDEGYEDEITEAQFTQEDIDNYVITFGKYKNNIWSEVRNDKDYVQWLYSTLFDEDAKFKCPEPLATFCQYEIEGHKEDDDDDIDSWEI